jgi:hypothetical protein
MMLDVCYPPSSSGLASFSYGKTPMMTDPTCNDMHILLIKQVRTRIKLNLFHLNANLQFDIFHE